MTSQQLKAFNAGVRASGDRLTKKEAQGLIANPRQEKAQYYMLLGLQSSGKKLNPRQSVAWHRLSAMFGTQKNVAKASAAVVGPRSDGNNTSMNSSNPDVRKIVEASKQEDKAKMADARYMPKSTVRKAEQATVKAKNDYLDKATASDDNAPKKNNGKSEVEMLHDKLLAAQCTDDDLRRIWDLYKQGKWPYGFGPKTKQALAALGLTEGGGQSQPANNGNPGQPTATVNPNQPTGPSTETGSKYMDILTEQLNNTSREDGTTRMRGDLWRKGMERKIKHGELTREQAEEIAKSMLDGETDEDGNQKDYTKHTVRRLQEKYDLDDITKGSTDISMADYLQRIRAKRGADGNYTWDWDNNEV